MRIHNWLSAVLLAAFIMNAGAQSAAPQFGTSAGQARPGAQPEAQGGAPRRGPPPEALAACQGKAGGATCSFNDRENRALTGTCFAPPAGAPGAQDTQGGQGTPPLACRPNRPGPPPEALAACQGKASGSACSFNDRENRALTGTCVAPPAGAAAGATLACRPLGAGPQGGQTPSQRAPGG